MYENVWLHANLYLSNVGNVGHRDLTLTYLLYIDFKDGLSGFRRWLQGRKVCDRSWWGTDNDVIDLKVVSVGLSKSMTFPKHNRAIWPLRCRPPVLPAHCGNSCGWRGKSVHNHLSMILQVFMDTRGPQWADCLPLIRVADNLWKDLSVNNCVLTTFKSRSQLLMLQSDATEEGTKGSTI